MLPFQEHTQLIPDDDDDTQITDTETQRIGSDTETETLEDPTLYGETQQLEDDDEIQNWVHTQVLADSEENAKGEITACEVEEEKKGDDLVGNDGSNDDDNAKGNLIPSELLLSGGSCKSNNGLVRSFASVRAASLRSSGLAAARSTPRRTTSGSISSDLKSSFSNDRNCKNQDSSIGSQTGHRASTMDLTLLSTEAGVDKDHAAGNCHKFTQDYDRDETRSRMNNPRVKKLVFEISSLAEEATTSKPDNTIGKLDSPRSHFPDYVAGGLSYIGSQEPGDLSQANALDAVDNFLSVNELGLSQEANVKKTDKVKSPPISAAKGIRRVAEKTDHRSPVGKKGIFDWNNSQEDDGGGELFSKRKDSFFGVKGRARKAHSQPPKSRHASSSSAGNSVHKSVKGCVNHKIHKRIYSSTNSESRSVLQSSFRKLKTKKNLFKDLNEQSSSKCPQQQVEIAVDDRGGGEDTYEVGPDTQIAAEAMEALVYAVEDNDAPPVPEKPTITPTEGVTRKKTPSKSGFPKRTSSILNSEGVSTRSKGRKLIPVNKSIEKKRFKGSTVKAEVKRKKRKLEEDVNGRSPVNGNEPSDSFTREKAQDVMDKTLIEEADKCQSSLTLNVQLSVSKELILGEFHVNCTPVAHRTRHSKAAKLSKQTEKLSRARRKSTNGLIDVRTQEAIGGDDKLVTDASGPRKMRRKKTSVDTDEASKVKMSFKSHTDAFDIDGLDAEASKAISFVNDVLTHPNRRRTSQISLGNQTITSNMISPSISADNMKPNTRHGKNETSVKSVAEILDTATRKKRSVSASTTDGIHSNIMKQKFVSSVRTRSSLKDPSFKHNLEKGSNECSARSVLCRAGSNDALDLCSTPFKQVADATSHVELAELNAKQEGTPKEDLRLSGVACATHLKDRDAVSPVFMVQDTTRASGSKCLSRSLVARELIRLEATETSPILTFNMRRRKDMASVRVLFSHHLDEDVIKQQKRIMGRLGVPAAASISDATHFVTDRFLRTRNMLEAMALGKPVVTQMWLESCGQASCFIDEKNYILRDAKKEKEIGFSMPVSLARACQHPLLQDKRVYITPNIKPDRELISSLVKAANGQPLERMGRSALKDESMPDDLLILSSEEDHEMCIPLLEKGAQVYSAELLLNGIVVQKLEYGRHRLFSDHVKRTRSTIWLRQGDGQQFLPVTRCT